MLKSSKWAPYEPPQEMLRALEERCAGPGVAGGPPAYPAVRVMLLTIAVQQEGLRPWLRWSLVPESGLRNHTFQSSALCTSGISNAEWAPTKDELWTRTQQTQRPLETLREIQQAAGGTTHPQIHLRVLGT